MPRRTSLITLAVLVGLMLMGAGGPAVVRAAAGGASAACVSFPETGKQVCGRFLEYWQANGGLAQQGLPLTDEFAETNPSNGKVYTTQYFERARFEAHPENVAPYDVLLGLLGNEQLVAKYGGTPPAGVTSNPLGSECVSFPETGKQVCGVFLAYWRANGGLAQQGLPKSDLFLETNPTDGKQYATQYFERARFEYHPENATTAPNYVVLLGLLGAEQRQAKPPTASPAPSATPAPSSAPRPGDIRYRDDFTDPASGWPRFSSDRLAGDYAGGSYVVKIKSPDDFLATNGPRDLTDVSVEVQVTNLYPSGTGRLSGLGLICRAKDIYNRYVFLIDSANQAAIFKQEQGIVTRMARSNQQVIKGAGEVNVLRAECVGDSLTFIVNGVAIIEVHDSALASGQAGFAATPPSALVNVLPEDQWAIIRFEHFVVRQR